MQQNVFTKATAKNNAAVKDSLIVAEETGPLQGCLQLFVFAICVNVLAAHNYLLYHSSAPLNCDKEKF